MQEGLGEHHFFINCGSRIFREARSDSPAMQSFSFRSLNVCDFSYGEGIRILLELAGEN
jgi:hypothetical protein